MAVVKSVEMNGANDFQEGALIKVQEADNEYQPVQYAEPIHVRLITSFDDVNWFCYVYEHKKFDIMKLLIE